MPGRTSLTIPVTHEFTELPAKGFNGRWTAARKAGVVDVVARGLMSSEDALSRYPGLSQEELQAWVVAVQSKGRRGLSARKGLAEVRPGTRFRATRDPGVIPAEAHRRISLTNLSFMGKDRG